MEHLIRQYGYAALFLGVLLEGESAVLLACLAVKAGYLKLMGVLGIAFSATYLGTEFAFGIAYWSKDIVFRWFPKLEQKVDSLASLSNRFGPLLVIGYRFLYGIRSVVPFGLGISKMSFRLFSGWNLAGALLWTAVVTTAGYFLGALLLPILKSIQKIEFVLFIIILLLIFWAVITHFLRKKIVRLFEK